MGLPKQPTSRHIWLVFWVALFVFLADQASKWAALHYLALKPLDTPLGWLRLNLVLNPHMLFGLPVKGALYFALFGLFAALVLAILLLGQSRQAASASRFSSPALLVFAAGLGLGAAAGNLCDRLRLGAVVDFIDLGFWPVFNLADVALTVAAFILLLHLLFGLKQDPVEIEAEPPSESPPPEQNHHLPLDT